MGILKKKKARPFLVFGDCHAPYHHRLTIDFLKRVHRDYECRDEVICVGDLFDFHAMSRHETEPGAYSPLKEYQKALTFAKELTTVFPKGVLILGNHDRIPQRQLKTLNIPEELLKEPNDRYGLPKGWRVEPLCHVIKPWDVLIEHGDNSTGQSGAINTAITKRVSFVQGHAHAFAGVQYSANHESLIFGLNTGCLCDNSSLAMKYAAYARRKGILGCGVVYSSSYAIFVPMYRENKKK